MDTKMTTASQLSPIETLRHMGAEAGGLLLDSMSAEEQEALMWSWSAWKRPNQTMPDTLWRVWMILAGRGFGKTRTGAETVRLLVDQNAAEHIALVGPTAGDVRDTMIEGESGLLSIYPPNQRPRYEPSKRRVTFHNGAMATAFSADEPDRLRGPNHDLAWADELAAWRYPEAWDMLMFGLRIGSLPRVIVTTTPRPTPLIRRLVGVEDGTVEITKGSTFDNQANLAQSFLDEVTKRYEGTRLGRQELYAEILDDVDGALWSRDQLEENRVTDHPPLQRIVVAIDPAAGSKVDNAETGIVVVGLGEDGKGYVLDDVSLRGTPNDWSRAAISAYHAYKADRIVAEANQGGDMVSHTLRTVDKDAPIKMVHASRGKRTRAEPIAALYEQGRIHHLGFHAELEDQLCSWVPDHALSPDRLDALVWGLTEIMVTGETPAVVPVSITAPSQWRL
jgi:phage terminase large subunit-like protein